MKKQVKTTSEWGNLFDYINWRGDLGFKKAPFNEVDGLILSVLAYLNFDKNCSNLSLKTCLENLEKLDYDSRYSGIFVMKDEAVSLANVLISCERFSTITVLDACEIINDEEYKHFSATSFLLDDDSIFIAFRGTDDTLIGWKESFSIAFLDKTPSQLEASIYANKIAEKYKNNIILGGHSKGGNLAIFAAANLENKHKDRLLQVLNYDGPGFLENFIKSDEFASIKDKITSFVPQSSVVGVLMDDVEYFTIKSDESFVLQHNPFSWKILASRFLYEKERSISGKFMGQEINKLIKSLNEKEREKYVETLFSVINSSKDKTLTDIEHHMIYHLFVTIPKTIKAEFDTNSKLKHEKE